MKINRLETHDRYEHFIQDQSQKIWEGAEECLKRNPLSLALQDNSPYIYIFAHPRTHEDGVTKRMLWQPRLTKPQAQPNSYLFRAQSHTDILEICWLLPPKEMWGQYKKGNVTHSDIVGWSISQFRNHREELERRSEDDLSDDKIEKIYLTIKNSMPKSAEVSPTDSSKG